MISFSKPYPWFKNQLSLANFSFNVFSTFSPQSAGQKLSIFTYQSGGEEEEEEEDDEDEDGRNQSQPKKVSTISLYILAKSAKIYIHIYIWIGWGSIFAVKMKFLDWSFGR